MPEKQVDYVPIDTSQLCRDDWPFVVGWLTQTIALNGLATREDVEKAIAESLARRAES